MIYGNLGGLKWYYFKVLQYNNILFCDSLFYTIECFVAFFIKIILYKKKFLTLREFILFRSYNLLKISTYLIINAPTPMNTYLKNF